MVSVAAGAYSMAQPDIGGRKIHCVRVVGVDPRRYAVWNEREKSVGERAAIHSHAFLSFHIDGRLE